MNTESRPDAALSRASDPAAGLYGLIAAIVPSLAAAVTVSAALWLSVAAIVALLVTALVAALAARVVPPAAGSFAVVLAAAALAGAADLAASTWLPLVRTDLGIYLPLSMLLVSGPVAAAVLADDQAEGRVRRALVRAVASGGAFIGGVVLTACARETLGAGTVTLPGVAGGRLFRVPGIAAAPARGLLAPFAGLIAAGYLAGLVVLAARRAARRLRRGPRGEEAR